MKVLCIIIASVLAFHGETAAVSPVQKVLQMMSEMKSKGENMVEEEKKTYGAYTEWVDDQTTQLGFDIKTENTEIEELLAFIAKADSDVDTLSAAVTELEGEISNLQNEKNEATQLRGSEHAEYAKISTDYSESVDALERAIQTMESKNYDVPQAEALLQRMAAGSSNSGVRRVLAEFMQASSKEEHQRGGPAVAAYEFQSGGIVKLLESFLDKFKGELADVEEAESNQAHNYKQEMLHLTNTLDYSNKELEEKSTLKAKRASESSAAKGNLADTKATLAQDQKTLADVKTTFEAKSATFAENQRVRKDELEAIGKAIEIISDKSVAGSYGEHVNLAQVTSLLQLGSARARVAARTRAASFLRRRAQVMSSQELEAFAAQLEANPFDKVITMVKDLIAKLKEEAAAEAEHKAWCDEQLHNNKIKREKKTSKVNKLTASRDGLIEDIEGMTQKIATLGSEQAALQKAMSEATAQRQNEKATNTDTMNDASAGEEATKQALVVLREFYSSQASLLQGRQAPEMAAYTGMASAKGGVVGMLEVISSDFARLYADTKASETAAATEYDSFMADSKASSKSKHDLQFKTEMAKDQTKFEKEGVVKDLKSTQTELDKALDYQEHLKPVCLEVHVSYEERVRRRKEEIASLKEAYEILDSK